MDLKPIWLTLAFAATASPLLAQDSPETAPPDCATIENADDLGEMFGDDRFTNNLQDLDACITQFIIEVQARLGNDPERDAVETFNELDAALAARIELFRTIGERFRAGSAFSDAARTLDLELDLIEANIESNAANGADVTAARAQLAQDRAHYNEVMADMQATRQQFSDVINQINEYRPILALNLRQKKFTELLTQLTDLNTQGSALARAADEQIRDFIDSQSDTRQGQN